LHFLPRSFAARERGGAAACGRSCPVLIFDFYFDSYLLHSQMYFVDTGA
jgi:hypothetical protein